MMTTVFFCAAGAVQAIRALDDTRLVDEASGWYDQGGGDVCSIHNYFYPLRVKPGKRTVALRDGGQLVQHVDGACIHGDFVLDHGGESRFIHHVGGEDDVGRLTKAWGEARRPPRRPSSAF